MTEWGVVVFARQANASIWDLLICWHDYTKPSLWLAKRFDMTKRQQQTKKHCRYIYSYFNILMSCLVHIGFMCLLAVKQNVTWG